MSVGRVPARHSATPEVRGPDSYNGFAYANPVRHVLANLLGAQKEVAAAPSGSNGDTWSWPTRASGLGDLEADAGPHHHTHVVFSASPEEPVESYLYQPLLGFYLAVVRRAKRLQSERLDAYVGYVLLALVAIMNFAAPLG